MNRIKESQPRAGFLAYIRLCDQYFIQSIKYKDFSLKINI